MEVMDSAQWLLQQRVRRTISNLKKRNMDGLYFTDRHTACQFVLEQIPAGSVVGIGGSTTIQQMGLLDMLRSGPYDLLDRLDPALSTAEKRELQLRCFRSDFFLSSCNALAETGEIVNIDHSGNRVAAMLYGPERVFVIAGVNKLVRDHAAALARAQYVAAPANAWRARNLYSPPCLRAGQCVECNSPHSICCSIVTIRRQPQAGRMSVVLVGEELGF